MKFNKKESSVKYTVILLIIIYISGCGSFYNRKIKGISNADQSSLNTIAVAKIRIHCKNIISCFDFIAEKGTVFEVRSMKDQKYKYTNFWNSCALHGYNSLDVYAVPFRKAKSFPDHVLFLPFNVVGFKKTNHNSVGFLVNPNGKWSFQNYHLVIFDASLGIWLLHEGKCSLTSETPFEIRSSN